MCCCFGGPDNFQNSVSSRLVSPLELQRRWSGEAGPMYTPAFPFPIHPVLEAALCSSPPAVEGFKVHAVRLLLGIRDL